MKKDDLNDFRRKTGDAKLLMGMRRYNLSQNLESSTFLLSSEWINLSPAFYYPFSSQRSRVQIFFLGLGLREFGGFHLRFCHHHHHIGKFL
jgi:hypothetical protein